MALAEAHREVITPLRKIRAQIEASPPLEDTDPDVLAAAIRQVLRGR